MGAAVARSDTIKSAVGNVFGTAVEYVRGFDARYLGLAVLPVLIENFHRVSLPVSLAAGCSVDPIALVCLYALTLILVCLIALMASLGKPLIDLRLRAVSVLCVLLGLMLAPLGILAGSSVPCAYALFVSAGILTSISLLGWLTALSFAPRRLLMAYCSAGVLLGKLLRCWFVADTGADVTFSACAVAGCCVLSMVLLAWIEIGHETCERSSRLRGILNWESSRTAPDSSPEAFSLADSLRASLNVVAVGYAVSWFTSGVLSVPPPTLATDHSMWTPVVDALVCTVLLAPVFAPQANTLRFAAALDRAHFAAPVMATCMVYFCFIRMIGATGTFKTVLSLVGDWGSLAFGMLFLYISALSCAERGIPAAVQVAPAIILCAVSFLGGTIAYSCFGNLAMCIQIFIITLYLLGITAGLVRRATTGEEARRLERVGKLSSRWGLSAREAEVFQLMTADYSNAAIAEALVISPETVRTHQKRVYAKAGVHKREDLVRVARGEG